MNLDDLRVFLVLAAECHFGRTADRMHVSTAQVSQRLKRLEQDLGGELMRRTTREAELTPLGRTLLREATPVLHKLDDLESRVQDQAAGRTGTLKLAVNGSATFTVLPSIVRVVRARLPGAKLMVQAQTYTALLEMALLEGAVDLIVGRTPLSSEELDQKSLFRDPMVLAVPVGHRFAGRRTASIADIAGEDLVSFPIESASAVAAITDRALRAEGVKPRRRAEAEETITLLGMVASGMGVAVMPASVSAIRAPGLAFVPMPSLPVADMVLAWRRDDHNLLVRTVADLLPASRDRFRMPSDPERRLN